jgi:hypothetical protein
MGTRNLTIVIHRGLHPIAQYGQWDGYPEGQGIVALEFCRQLSDPLIRGQFIKNLEKVQHVNDADINYRDYGAFILNKVLTSTDDKILLEDSYTFAGNSLFCEWAYVVDLDNNTLEVYGGFNEEPLPSTERFAKLECSPSSEYYPVRHLVSFKLDDLPSNEGFIKQADPECEGLKSPTADPLARS